MAPSSYWAPACRQPQMNPPDLQRSTRAVLQKSTATTPTPAAHQNHQWRRAGAQRQQTPTRPRGLQIRGPRFDPRVNMAAWNDIPSHVGRGGIRVAAQDRWTFRHSVPPSTSMGVRRRIGRTLRGVMASRLGGRCGWRPVSPAPRLRPNGWVSRCIGPPWRALRLAFQSRLARSRRQQR